MTVCRGSVTNAVYVALRQRVRKIAIGLRHFVIRLRNNFIGAYGDVERLVASEPALVATVLALCWGIVLALFMERAIAVLIVIGAVTSPISF
jgi:hypothetical protein